MRTAVLIALACCMVIGVQCYPEFNARLREVLSELLEKEESGYPPKLDKPYSRSLASRSLSAFNSRSKQTAKRLENVKRDEIDLLSNVADPNLVKRLEELQVFSRAILDPFCDISIDCSDNNNRIFVDSKEFRTSTGQCNNVDNFSWGMAGVQHLRLLDDAYQNGQWAPRMRSVTSARRVTVELPSARSISNAVHKTDSDKETGSNGVSLALFYFMQFIDHDLVKTPEGRVPTTRDCCTDNRGFCLPITVAEDDDAFNAGDCMDARRSDTVFRCNDDSGFQNQYNDITAYIDASMIYGSSDDEMNDLRSGVGGHLKTSTRAFMPEATADVESRACGNVEDPAFCFYAGDTRSDVHPSLTTYHTMFVREHNRIAKYLGEINTGWSDDRIFFETRKIVAAMIQHIVYDEMLPKLLDSSVLAEYGLNSGQSYDNTLDASIIQAFSLAYRYHNLMPSNLHMADLIGVNVEETALLEQEDVWQNPEYLFESNYDGVNRIALGFVNTGCPLSNGMMNDASRNSLFVDSAGNKFDLASLNIERGREWGTPSYTEFRDKVCGLGAATTWNDISDTHDTETISKLSSVYADVRDVDLWTGVVLEMKLGNSLSGKVQSCLVAKQFANTRNGDRFWYESTDDPNTAFTSTQLTEIKNMKLSSIFCNNLDIEKVRSDVFDTNSAWTECGSITGMNLAAWAEAN